MGLFQILSDFINEFIRSTTINLKESFDVLVGIAAIQ